jgi:hypothetical protein
MSKSPLPEGIKLKILIPKKKKVTLKFDAVSVMDPKFFLYPSFGSNFKIGSGFESGML